MGDHPVKDLAKQPNTTLDISLLQIRLDQNVGQLRMSATLFLEGSIIYLAVIADTRPYIHLTLELEVGHYDLRDLNET